MQERGSGFILSNTLIIAFLTWSSVLSSQLQTDTIVVTYSGSLGVNMGKPESIWIDTSQGIPYLYSAISSILGGQLLTNTPGGLATFLHRGHGHRHLAVLWEEINLQNPVNGTFDLNLIPLELLQGSGFTSFASPVVQGVNAMAGTITLRPSTVRENTVGIQLNSMNNILAYTNIFFDNSTHRHHIGLSFRMDNNNYKYNFFGQEYKRIGADFCALNVYYKSSFALGKNGLLNVALLYQDAERGVPVSVTSEYQHQRQLDRALRANVNYLWSFQDVNLEFRTFFMKEKLQFLTPTVFSLSDLNRGGADITLYQGSERNNFLSLRYRNDLAIANFYSDYPKRISYTVAAGKLINLFPKSRIQLQGAIDWIDEEQWLPSWYIGFEYTDAKLSYARSNNLPGFNDLYWPAGGNKDLKQEYSDKFQLSYFKELDLFTIKSFLYTSIINDWILWTPGPSGLWTPDNQKRVWSRGAEILLEKEFAFGKWNFKPSAEYSINNTTITDHYSNTGLRGKRLIFVPQHQMMIGVKIVKQDHALNLSYHFTSSRFADLQNTDILSPIPLVNFDYCFVGLNNWIVSFKIDNLLNQTYEINRFFPMPLRNFSVNIQYFINKNKT